MDTLDIIEVWPGDVVLTRGKSLIAKLVTWGETSWSERKRKELSWASHGGMFVEKAPFKLAKATEALWTVESHPWYEDHIGDVVTVYRRLGVTDSQREEAAKEINRYIGRKYGWWKLIPQLIDNRILNGRYATRRLYWNSNRPYCTYILGDALTRAGLLPSEYHGKAFSPDDFDDLLGKSTDWVRIVYRIEVK